MSAQPQDVYEQYDRDCDRQAEDDAWVIVPLFFGSVALVFSVLAFGIYFSWRMLV